MRNLFGIGALVLGVLGAILCAIAIGLGWRFAVKSVDRVNRVAARLDQGLAQSDVRLARVESRLNAVRSDVDDTRKKAEAIADENPELPRVKAEIEQLLGRLVPALDRVDATADSLRSVAENFRTASDLVDFFATDPDATVRFRSAADSIDRSADELDGIRIRVDELKSAKAVRLTRGLVTLAREAAASSERLAAGLATARQGLAVARDQSEETRGDVVFWVYVSAAAHTLFWFWCGLGQLCLISWGRRHTRTRDPA